MDHHGGPDVSRFSSGLKHRKHSASTSRTMMAAGGMRTHDGKIGRQVAVMFGVSSRSLSPLRHEHEVIRWQATIDS